MASRLRERYVTVIHLNVQKRIRPVILSCVLTFQQYSYMEIPNLIFCGQTKSIVIVLIERPLVAKVTYCIFMNSI